MLILWEKGMLVLHTNGSNPAYITCEMITCTVNRMIGYTWQVIPFSGPTPTSQSLDMNLKKERGGGSQKVLSCHLVAWVGSKTIAKRKSARQTERMNGVVT